MMSYQNTKVVMFFSGALFLSMRLLGDFPPATRPKRLATNAMAFVKYIYLHLVYFYGKCR